MIVTHISQFPSSLVLCRLTESIIPSQSVESRSDIVKRLLQTMSCLGASTPRPVIRDVVGLYLLLKRSIHSSPSSDPSYPLFLRRVSVERSDATVKETSALCGGDGCSLLLSVVASFFSNSHGSPSASSDDNEEFDHWKKFLQKHSKFLEPVLQRVHEHLQHSLQRRIVTEASRLKRPSPMKAEKWSQVLSDPSALTQEEEEDGWRLLTSHLFHFFTHSADSPLSSTQSRSQDETIERMKEERRPCFCHLSKSHQKKYLSLCQKYFKYCCDKSLREVRRIQFTLSDSKKTELKCHSQRHHRKAAKQRQRLSSNQSMNKKRSRGSMAMASSPVWVERDEQDSDYDDRERAVDSTDNERDEEDGEDLSSSESSESEERMALKIAPSIGLSCLLPPLYTHLSLSLVAIFPEILSEFLSFACSDTPSLIEILLDNRSHFLTVPNLGRDFVAKFEEFLFQLIQLSKLFQQTTKKYGEQV
jgi:hypothetical protein